jgi:hypothetical protein
VIDVRSVDFLGDPTRGELDQQGVHATHDPCPLVADVDVAFGEQAQHLGVTDWLHSPQTPRAQCRDGDRQRIVGVILVRPAAGQQPRTRRQRGRHIDNRLTDRNELLGEQITQPTS